MNLVETERENDGVPGNPEFNTKPYRDLQLCLRVLLRSISSGRTDAGGHGIKSR